MKTWISGAAVAAALAWSAPSAPCWAGSGIYIYVADTADGPIRGRFAVLK